MQDKEMFMTNQASAVKRCAACSIAGLALIFVWSSLSDHMFDLQSTLPAFLGINPRLFFLLGILGLSVAFITNPDTTQSRGSALDASLPFVGSLGTVCMAMASRQDLFDPGALCIIGLIALGVGYCWLTTRFGLLLAQRRSIDCLVYCIATALVLEPILRFGVESIVNQAVLVTVAMAMPVVAAILLLCAQRAMRSELIANLQDETALPALESRTPAPTDGQAVSKTHVILLFATALLLGTVRTISPVGTWDAKFDPAPMTSSWELLAAYAALVAIFARFALVGAGRKSSLGRFQPAFLITVITLFTSFILAYMLGAKSAVLYTCMCLDDSFAHLLFWTTIALMIKLSGAAPFRLVGMAATVYTVGSIFWLLLLGDSEIIQASIMLVAIVILYALTIVVNNTRNAQHSSPSANSQNTASSDDDEAAANRIARNLEERCAEVAQEYKLSPRETEIMTLIVQGKTRLSIQEELVLAENTVKTHISHIYRKAGIASRQELFDLVFGSDDGAEG